MSLTRSTSLTDPHGDSVLIDSDNKSLKLPSQVMKSCSGRSIGKRKDDDSDGR